MKKVLLAIMTMLLPMLASADPVEIDGIYYELNSGDYTATVSRNPNKYAGVVNIPEKITYEKVDYIVNSIAGGAFHRNYSLSSVIIPNSITTIGSSAFEHCTGLGSITIGCGVKEIGINAFDDCKLINSVHISDLKAWCSIKFAGPESNPLYFAKKIYINGEEIKTLEIPSNVTSICDMAFYYCKSLTSIIIHNGVKSIGKDSFGSCSGLTSLTIPNSVTTIDDGAFSECSGLTSVIIGNSVTTIGKRAFRGCSGLTSVIIGNSVTAIGNYAFFGCSGLTSVFIGNSVTTIGQQAFSNCDNYTDIYCLVEKVSDNYSEGYEGLYTSSDAFQDTYPQNITLHVPVASIEDYRSIIPWSSFGSIVALESSDIPPIEKCANPTISLINGEIQFSCETEGVEFISDVIVSDAKSYYDDKITAPKKFKVIVYATKSGYDNSDKVTEEFDFSGDTAKSGDVDGNGVVNVADHVKLSDIIMHQEQ